MPARAGLAAVLAGATLAGVISTPLEAQRVQGRLVDSDNGAPVGLAGVFLLSIERDPIVGSASDTAGYYSVEAPEAGDYIVFVQRIGYFENESPLVALEAGGSYGVDFEMRPEPFRLDPIEVAVQNEELESYLTLELGVNPNSVFGYRAYQGVRLQEAKLQAVDNTDLLRELYIPVSHGIDVCVGTIGMGHAERRSGVAGGERQCGALWVDGLRMPNEHIESLEMERIAVVVTFPGSVRLYTFGFDWSFRPGRRR